MADDLIKRSDVQDALHSAIIEWNKDCGIARMEYLRIRFNNIPAADVVEVVRCKDCRYSTHEDEYELWCNGFCNPARLVRDVDYCSHGAAKT